MKICVISTPVFKTLPPSGAVGYSGLEVIAWQQAKHLALLGHEVGLVTPDASTCPGVRIIPSGPEKTWDEETAHSRVWKELLGYDVIIDHTWQKHSYMLKAEGALKAPILGVMHAPVNTMYQTLPPVENPCMVCISQDQADQFYNIHNRRAEVAYNGIDLDFYKPMSIKRTDRFLFLARFSSIKGADIAIEACKAAGVPLDLIGDTSITNEPDYLKHIQNMADGEKIRFVGSACRAECVRWYSQALALLHPVHRFREPFGLAPVEAMACGCPVIAWDNGAMRETIEHGKTGWLERNQKDFFLRVKSVYLGEIGQMAEWNRIDRGYCREFASRFSVQHMAKRYEELCNKALSGEEW